MGYFVKNRRLQSGSSGVVLPAGGSAVRPNNPSFGLIRFNTDTANVEFFNGTEYTQLAPYGNIVYSVDQFTGDESTTIFTMSQGAANTQSVIVFVGSIYQDPFTAYTLSGLGNIDINFASAPPAGEPIRIIHSTTP